MHVCHTPRLKLGYHIEEYGVELVGGEIATDNWPLGNCARRNINLYILAFSSHFISRDLCVHVGLARQSNHVNIAHVRRGH